MRQAALPHLDANGVQSVGYRCYLRSRAAVKGLGVTSWAKRVERLDLAHTNSRAICGPWVDRTGVEAAGALLFVGARCKKEPERFLGAILRTSKGGYFSVSNEHFYFSGRGVELVADTTSEQAVRVIPDAPEALGELLCHPVGNLAHALWREGIRPAPTH